MKATGSLARLVVAHATIAAIACGQTRDGGNPGDGGNAGDAGNAAACTSDIPCSSDLQCVTLAGYACNRALSPPTCQRLSCGVTEACDRDEFCAPGRVCRVIDHAQGERCWPEVVTPDECLTSCMTAPPEPGCPEPSSICSNVCSDLNALCRDNGGLKFVEEISRCEFVPIHSADVILRCRDGHTSTHSFSF